MDHPTTTRDEQGRFLTGNPGGPGRPRGHGRQLRDAAEQAITPQHVEAIMRRALRMALEGNLVAMKFVVERSCGRAPDVVAQPEPLAIELPKIVTVADCAAATATVTEAIVKGTITESAAKLLFEAVQTRLKTIETQEHEARIEDLERNAAMVQTGKGKR